MSLSSYLLFREPQAVAKDPEFISLFGNDMAKMMSVYQHTHDHSHHENLMIEPFLIRATIAGIGVAIITGAIGCFVVWRKMAYFGDSLAHSALLGVALGLVLGISTNLGTMIICSVFAILLIWLQQKKY